MVDGHTFFRRISSRIARVVIKLLQPAPLLVQCGAGCFGRRENVGLYEKTAKQHTRERCMRSNFNAAPREQAQKAQGGHSTS